MPLYQHFADLAGRRPLRCPGLTINLFSGGKHAGGQVPIQDVLVVPLSATTIDDGLAPTYAVYQAAAELSAERYGMRAADAPTRAGWPRRSRRRGDVRRRRRRRSERRASSRAATSPSRSTSPRATSTATAATTWAASRSTRPA